MKSYKPYTLLLIIALLLFSGCSKDKDTNPHTDHSFEITEHFIAGTLTQQGGSAYTSVFFIQFLENDKALMINSGANNLVGSYTLTDEELIFEVTGDNARVARFSLNDQQEVTSAYYQALDTEYEATAELLPNVETNELAGKTFKGTEFKMGGTSHQPDFIYSFNKDENTFGSGVDGASIDHTEHAYTLIGGHGFKYSKDGHTELGYVSGDMLTVFKIKGLYYYGNYTKQ